MMAEVAESSANAAVKKVTAAWKKRGREEQHAIEKMRSTITQLNLDSDDELISNDQSIWQVVREEFLKLTSNDGNSNNNNKKQSCFEYSNAKLTFEN